MLMLRYNDAGNAVVVGRRLMQAHLVITWSRAAVDMFAGMVYDIECIKTVLVMRKVVRTVYWTSRLHREGTR